MIRGVRELVRRQQFRPGPMGIIVNPFYLARRGLAAAIRDHAYRLSGRLLDVGCGSKPYRNMFRVSGYVGLDIDSPSARERGTADVYYDGGRFPFDAVSFDCVLCNQVLEHVFNPREFMAEIVRVLRPGGLLLLTVPFVWDEHEQPHDYARYSSFGLKALLEDSGLAVLAQVKILADVSVIFQLLNAYLFKVTQTRWGAVNVLTCAFLMAPVTLAGLALARILPSNPDLFLDQLVLAEKA